VSAALDNADGLKDRVVLLVGAHGGLGQAVALALARAGVQMVLLGRNLPKLNRLHTAVVAAGGRALLYPLDLEGATPDDYAEFAARIDGQFGHLDGVLHCAAYFRNLTPLELTAADEFARAVHVNLTARWWLTQACLPLLRNAPDAAVVFVLGSHDKVTRRAVRMGRALGGDREILDGLDVGENVVLSPAPELADGDAVQPRDGT